jgi:hypothetical protein
MRRMMVAIRAFFCVLLNRQGANEIQRALDGSPGQAPPAELSSSDHAVTERPSSKQAVRSPARNDAVTLLSALQREARFVDFIQEPIGAYSDAQIGAAVRDIHRDCGKLLERIFGLRPIESGSEGSEIQLTEGFDPTRFRLVGNIVGRAPFHGKLVHHGWQSTRCDLPEWTGSERSIGVVAPAEVEMK